MMMMECIHCRNMGGGHGIPMARQASPPHKFQWWWLDIPVIFHTQAVVYLPPALPTTHTTHTPHTWCYPHHTCPSLHTSHTPFPMPPACPCTHTLKKRPACPLYTPSCMPALPFFLPLRDSGLGHTPEISQLHMPTLPLCLPPAMRERTPTLPAPTLPPPPHLPATLPATYLQTGGSGIWFTVFRRGRGRAEQSRGGRDAAAFSSFWWDQFSILPARIFGARGFAPSCCCAHGFFSTQISYLPTFRFWRVALLQLNGVALLPAWKLFQNHSIRALPTTFLLVSTTSFT